MWISSFFHRIKHGPSKRDSITNSINNYLCLATYLREENESEIDVDQVKSGKGERCLGRCSANTGMNQGSSWFKRRYSLYTFNEKYRGEFEELFYRNLAKCEKLIRSLYSYAASSAGSTVASSNASLNLNVAGRDDTLHMIQSAVKLTTFQILVFAGVYTDWQTFYDIFSALIYNNGSLSKVQQFFNLRSSLTGDAEKVIKYL